MLCEACKKRIATVHVTEMRSVVGEPSPPSTTKHDFCAECGDRHLATVQTANSAKDIVQFPAAYRSGLYDELERKHPNVFNWWHSSEEFQVNSELIFQFLRMRLDQDGIEISGDDFITLYEYFIESPEFNERRRKRSGVEPHDGN